MIREFGINDAFLLGQGLRWTVMITLVAFVGGGIGGLLVALCRTSSRRLVRILFAGYIDVFQGTPLLLQLFVVYFGITFLGIELSPWVAVTAGLTLHASAFLGEIWRGGIEAVAPGQSEAATALSLSYFARMRHVVLPQAFHISLPATVGFLVQLIKGTSLAAIIGFTELARTGQIISNATFRPMLVFSLVGLIYFMLCWPLSAWGGYLERRQAAASR